ncbi:MAG: hypothetical protein CMO19_02670 [Thaumarchaeota archaeon]|nr:hypothetical protein [Nitrososphaerota archaeon]
MKNNSMNKTNDVKKKIQEWKIQISVENDSIILVLIDKNNNRVSINISKSEFRIENVHEIGRNLEFEYNKANNVILEPYNISRIIGLVNDQIRAESDK